MYASKQAVTQNLLDAGCDCETVAQFLLYEKECDRKGQLALLASHRLRLLEQVHQEEKRIACLDYLVYQLEKTDDAL